MTQYAILPITVLAWTGPNQCETCHGLGVTGERYEMNTPNGPILLVDVFCPGCGGCGNGDPGHRECRPVAHAYPEELGLDTYPNYDDDGQDQDPTNGCPSCLGRQWNPVQGFSTDPDPDALLVLRVPCGCTTPILVTGTDPAALAPYPATS